MQIIQRVRIENFRSIKFLDLEDAESYFPLIGLNSSGKSNFLRALNLFFNGYIDEDDTALDMSRDYCDYAPKRKRKRIAVGVEISLGENFKVRNQNSFQQSNNLVDSICILKEWTLDGQSRTLIESVYFGPSFDELTLADSATLANVLTHVRSIIFRYIPNHARPGDLIRAQLAPLRQDIIARLQSTKEYKDASVADLMTALSRMGESMFGEMSESLSRGLPSTTVSAALPSDFAELAFTVGVESISDAGVARPPELEGSGTQSFMLLHILDLGDRAARGHSFGWVQASIWAMEEPESFLHAGLRARFSTDLAAFADDPRRQVFATTHADEFVRAANTAWLANKGTDGTSVQKMSARQALQRSTKQLITNFHHPLFEYPDHPIVVVEGKWDDEYLRAAITQAGLRTRWRLLQPDELFGTGSSGDALKRYLQFNKTAVASRPDTAPVIVLRDWEANDANAYNKHLEGHEFSTCLTAPKSLANPELSSHFVGIERFLTTQIVTGVIDPAKLGRTSLLPDAMYTIQRGDLEDAKMLLQQAVVASRDVGPFLLSLAAWLDGEVNKIMNRIPVDRFV